MPPLLGLSLRAFWLAPLPRGQRFYKIFTWQTLFKPLPRVLLIGHVRPQCGQMRNRVQLAFDVSRDLQSVLGTGRVLRLAGQRLEKLVPDPNFGFGSIARVPQGVARRPRQPISRRNERDWLVSLQAESIVIW